MAGTSRKAGRTRARRLRADHGIPLDVPLPDVLALAEHDIGVPVAIFERLGDDLAGAYVRRGDRRLILLNGSDHPVRLRFTLAHELGHHCFGDDVQPDTHAGLVGAGHWMEVRANAFASELLMPAEAVERWARRHDLGDVRLADLVEMALAFGVSALVACFRLHDAGLIDDPDPLRRDIEAGVHRQAFERGAPYGDSLLEAVDHLPYVPASLQGSLLFRAAMGRLPVAEAARRLGVTERRLRDAWAPFHLLPPA